MLMSSHRGRSSEKDPPLSQGAPYKAGSEITYNINYNNHYPTYSSITRAQSYRAYGEAGEQDDRGRHGADSDGDDQNRHDRNGDHGDSPPPPPRRAPPHALEANSPKSEFFVDGGSIDKEVLTVFVANFIDASAQISPIYHPITWHCHGYMVNAKKRLNASQLKSLMQDSKDWHQEKRSQAETFNYYTYKESKTWKRRLQT